MKRSRLSFEGASIVPVALSIAILQGPIGFASSVFGSCATFAPQVALPAAGPVEGIAVADDRCDAAPSCKIVSVTSSDPGPKPSPGRIYTINVACTDAAGNVTSGQTAVTVEGHCGKPPRTAPSISQRF